MLIDFIQVDLYEFDFQVRIELDNLVVKRFTENQQLGMDDGSAGCANNEKASSCCCGQRKNGNTNQLKLVIV